MSRTIPETLAYHANGERQVLARTETEHGLAYETGCPVCLGTLTILPSQLRTHRDETVSTKRVVTCEGCETPFSLLRSVLEPAEPADEDEETDW